MPFRERRRSQRGLQSVCYRKGNSLVNGHFYTDSSPSMFMIRKTKHNKQLVRDFHGILAMAEGVTTDDILNKLHHYEKLEKEGRIMEMEPAHWIKSAYDNRYICSHCGSLTRITEIEGMSAYKFCPYCNAKMLGRKYK